MKAHIVTLGILLAASSAAAQGPEPVRGEPLPAPAPVEAAPSGTPDPNAASPAPDAPAAEASVAADASAAGTPAVDAAALSGEMTEAELLEFGLGANQSAVDTSLRLSGFIDFGMQVGLSDGAKAALNDRAFAIGNLNLYISKSITESVRTMAEVRLLYLPNGATAGGAGATEVANTSSGDYNDFNRSLHWGGIEIERVYLEWAVMHYLTIRGGQFLTPYGVWNVDHGTPTIIPAVKPYVIGVGYFPERQTGLELYGRTGVNNFSDVGYHLTLSNGTGPVAEWKDMDKNKAVGARVFWEWRRFGEFRLGGSSYYGRNTDASSALSLENGMVRSIVTVKTQFDVLAFGLDAVWKFRGLHLQGEWVSAQRNYTKAGRVATTDPTGATSFPVDVFSWGVYGVAGYRFEWYGVMPYLMAQHLSEPDSLTVNGFHYGLNVRPIDALALKIQHDLVNFPGTGATKIRAIYLQAAWAF